ncbi:MAG: hypothetical protein KGO96_06350 [Elusimicrobia bacterium]|nr:hypothetical protein [Elusimicrobiota bacterium]MDE2425511.1 hypothetical protein [Elusimicrobiota bacterium]
MMKNDVRPGRGPAQGTSFIRIDTNAAFLNDKREGVDLEAAGPLMPSCYVWKRVFLRRKTR